MQLAPGTTVEYFDPLRPRPEVARHATVIAACDKEGHAHLAIYAHPIHDPHRAIVEQKTYVPFIAESNVVVSGAHCNLPPRAAPARPKGKR